MNNYKDADIIFQVETNSCQESNLFLRKFYDELSKFGKNGWHFQSERENNIIFVGRMNYGAMWISYKEKGKIDKVIIESESSQTKKQVLIALKNAKNNFNVLKTYTLTVIFKTLDISFLEMRKNQIEIYSEDTKEGILTKIQFPVQAFGEEDLKYVIANKVPYLEHLLCAYTNILFENTRIYYCEGENNLNNNEWEEPCQRWVDTEEVFINNHLSLCSNFFYLFEIIINNYEFDRKIRLLLNASQEIFISKKILYSLLKEDGGPWNIPGYIDLANTLVLSILEPLSNIFGEKAEVCDKCGNLKYSIAKKIKNLCQRYLPMHLVNEIYQKRYNERSKFLHEGNTVTNEFYCGHCVPLLDPVDGRSMMQPSASINLNMFDYVTFIFRQVSADVLKDSY